MNQLAYVSASGAVIELDVAGATVGTADDIRGNKWDYSMSDTGAVSGIARKARKASLAAVFQDKAAADAACSAFESDMRAGVPGTLHAQDGWVQRALVVEEDLADVNPFAVQLKLSVLLLDGVWRRTTVVHLVPGSADSTTTTGLDLPSDIPFDLAGTASSTGITSLESGGCKVGVTFFGPCANPYVHIGPNIYGVNSSAQAGERIVIDPTMRHVIGRSVYRVGQWGEVTNLYDYRRRGAAGSGSYVFEELEAGTYDVSWPQSFGVDIALVEERGVLPWS